MIDYVDKELSIIDMTLGIDHFLGNKEAKANSPLFIDRNELAKFIRCLIRYGADRKSITVDPGWLPGADALYVLFPMGLPGRDLRALEETWNLDNLDIVEERTDGGEIWRFWW